MISKDVCGHEITGKQDFCSNRKEINTMMSERESKLKFYSLGIVAVNKEKKSDHIKVTPIEELTLSNGKLSEQKNIHKVELPDAKGIDRTSELESDMMLVAKWLAFGQSNRMTPPDVIAGETVIIFRFADTDEYYWTSIFREPGIRRLETVMYAFCNIPSGQEAFNKETSYWLEVSTDEKHVKLHTSKNDGEPYEYDITLDTAKGSLLIDDNIGNTIELNSEQNKLSIITNTEVYVKTPKVTIEAEETHITGNVTVDGNMTVKQTTTTNKQVTENGTQSTGGVQVEGGMNVQGNTTLQNDLEVNGKMKGQGGLESSGPISASGGDISGSLNVSGDITAGGQVRGTNIQ